MMTQAPTRIGPGNWIITHIQMLTFMLSLSAAASAILGAIIGGAIYMSHEATMISDLEKQVGQLQRQNAKMEGQISKIYCSMAGHAKFDRDCDVDSGK